MSVSTAIDQGRTMTEVLAARLRRAPDDRACALVDARGETTTVTVRQLLGKAMAYAEHYGLRRGDPKVIGVCLYHSLDLHAAFLGALWAGHIPTMLAPPSPRMEKGKYVHSFREMLKHIHPAGLVVDAVTREKLHAEGLEGFSGVQLIQPHDVAADASVAPWPADPDEVALLQHSSGTTGLQKGVALTHRAVLTHNALYARRIGLSAADTIVSWLPLYHDMGFIACFLLPLLEGVPFVEMSSFDWVQRPAMLLEQIHRQRGTLCWLPNFAYAFLASAVRVGQLPPGLDLHSIRAWVNCSEPVLHASQMLFLERFRPFGVSESQLTMSYAMAENVFGVTQSLPGEYRRLAVWRRPLIEEHRIEVGDDPDAAEFVSNGRPLEDTEVRVLDERERPLPADRVGELVLRGPHLFSGYFRRDDLTRQAMTSDGWYRTGDLGFVHDGEVYITGRKKDLLIIQGKNFYPTDVEQTAGEIEGVIAGRVVAFGVPDPESGTERLVILAETEELAPGQDKLLVLRIRNAVSQQLGCTASAVHVVPPRFLVKSTAGKLARNDNRTKYLELLAPQGSTAHV